MEISSISLFKSYCPWQFSGTQCTMKCRTGVGLLTGRAEHNSRHCIPITHSATHCKNYQRGLSAGYEHLLIICLLGFLPGKGPLWRIFSLPSINTISIWIFPYNLFQREYRGCKRAKKEAEISVLHRTGFLPPVSISKLKNTISWGECLIWNYIK